MGDVGDERERLRLLGNDAFMHGLWEEAVRLYGESLMVVVEGGEEDKRVYSNRSAARLKLAELVKNEGDRRELLQGALDDAEEAIRIDATWAKGYYRKGMALETMGRIDDAVAAFAEGLRINPQDAEQLVTASSAMHKLAEEMVHQNEATAPTTTATKDAAPASGGEAAHQAEVLRLEGNAAFKAQNWDQAIRSYTEALNSLNAEGLEPDKRIYSNRSAAYLEKANETDSKLTHQYAIEDAEKCVMLDSTWAKGWYRLGLALKDDGREDEGKLKIEQGLLMCPGDVDLEKALEKFGDRRKGGGKGGGSGVVGENDGGKEQPRSGHVVDKKLYDLLGVKPSATSGEIKRAYLLLAKETHPDKNKGDPAATEKFQAIGQAYQVLWNPETRDVYDKYGMEGLENVDYENVDPAELFAMMFGSDRFERYLGELQLTSMISRVDSDGNPPSDEVKKQIQQERIQTLTASLIDILQPQVDGRHRDFVEWARKEAEELKETNFGSQMLFVVGQTYVRHANIAMGKHQFLGLPGYWRQLNFSRHKIGTQWSATASALRVVTQQKQLEEEVKKAEKEGKTLTEEQQTSMAANVASGYLDVMWKQTVMDIVYTLDEVCHRVLEGKDIVNEEEDGTKRRKGSGGGGHGGGGSGSNGGGGGFNWKSTFTSKLFTSKMEPPKDGVKAVGKTHIVLARAAALKTLGSIFMESGKMEMDQSFAEAFGQKAGDVETPNHTSHPTATAAASSSTPDHHA